MPVINYSASLSGAGETIHRDMQRVVEGVNSRIVSLPAGKAGVLTTRTSASIGVITLDSGHGFVEDQRVDLYWTGGVRYAVNAASVTETTVLPASGHGDDLPSQGTSLIVCKHVAINTFIDGDLLSILGVELSYASPNSIATGHLYATDADVSGTLIAAINLAANVPQVWDVAGGISSPLASAEPAVYIGVSNGSATEVATLRIVWATDVTP